MLRADFDTLVQRFAIVTILCCRMTVRFRKKKDQPLYGARMAFFDKILRQTRI